jgi:hypothetical protein
VWPQVYAYYEPEEPRPELRVTAEEVLQLSQQRDGVLLLDTRSAEQYTAQVRTGVYMATRPAVWSLLARWSSSWLWLWLARCMGTVYQHDSNANMHGMDWAAIMSNYD